MVLPEKWPAFGTPAVIAGSAQPLDGPLLQEVASWARRLGVAIVAGRVRARARQRPRPNASVALDREGRLVASYGKVHLFDVDVTGAGCANPTATWPATSSPCASSAAFRLR